MSRIEEKVYDMNNNQDPEDYISNIVKMGPQKVQE